MIQRRMEKKHRIRYAVVGLGHISQAAVLPAFAHARRNSELVGLVSGDPVKLQELGRRYRVKHRVGYDDYDDYLRSGSVDAVYIALPNDLHREYTERAADAGIHVLCEKPLAVTGSDCRAMIRAASQSGVKLMTAYRLHFEKANLAAIDLVRSGRLGEPRFIHSVLSMQVREGDIRVRRARGGGPLLDVGIYCINAARYLFQDEPIEATAMAASLNDRRFREVDETVTALLRFPGERMAAFTCSFGAADVTMVRIVGTEGDLRVEPSFEYAGGLTHHLTIRGKSSVRHFPKRDQFAAELLYFSECILEDREPEPSGMEGLADVRVIDAIQESLHGGRRISLPPFSRTRRPHLGQEIHRPPVRKREEIRARSPHAEPDER
ncbi:MAG: gfo/Idh/MocA family oxidoreductase [Planctomycetota bacterium]|nr:MAG: gfo/Idh/MocA family oxidoreductase [Planctomycetota bacterium]